MGWIFELMYMSAVVLSSSRLFGKGIAAGKVHG